MVSWRELPVHQRRTLVAISVLAQLSFFQNANAAFCTPMSDDGCWPSKGEWFAWQQSKLSANAEVVLQEKTPDVFLSMAVSMNLLKSNYPSAIVIPATEADVCEAVQFASSKRIRIATRCSGHDFNGRSNARSAMILKTGQLNNVTYNASTMTVTFGSGASHGDIYAALVRYKRVYVGGQSKTVCPAGCLAGGCHGLLSRKYGLGIDSILAIKFVLYNGTMVTLTNTSHASLFHAYLGAGQNSFGVAVSFTAVTYPAPPAILQIDATFNLLNPKVSNAAIKPNLLSQFFMNVTWFNSMPRTLSGNININGDTVDIKFFYQGTNITYITSVLRPLFTSPFYLASQTTNYTNMYDVALNNYAPASDIWQRKYIGNGFLPANQTLLNNLTGVIVNAKPYMWLWFVFGGAVTTGTAGSVPPGMRSAMYEAVLGTQWNDPGEDMATVSNMQQYLSILYSATQHSYNNEFTSWGGFGVPDDWQTRFFSNYTALLHVKQSADPCNLFTAKYAVGSTLPEAICSA